MALVRFLLLFILILGVGCSFGTVKTVSSVEYQSIITWQPPYHSKYSSSPGRFVEHQFTVIKATDGSTFTIDGYRKGLEEGDKFQCDWVN